MRLGLFSIIRLFCSKSSYAYTFPPSYLRGPWLKFTRHLSLPSASFYRATSPLSLHSHQGKSPISWWKGRFCIIELSVHYKVKPESALLFCAFHINVAALSSMQDSITFAKFGGISFPLPIRFTGISRSDFSQGKGTRFTSSTIAISSIYSLFQQGSLQSRHKLEVCSTVMKTLK